MFMSTVTIHDKALRFMYANIMLILKHVWLFVNVLPEKLKINRILVKADLDGHVSLDVYLCVKVILSIRVQLQFFP